jgi:peptidoglycan/LPS O-acetylase OafA/YrhL
LLREKGNTNTIRIPSFYLGRVLRIWPLYFAMIGVGWVYGLFSASHTLCRLGVSR